jgi:hypothetical protein
MGLFEPTTAAGQLLYDEPIYLTITGRENVFKSYRSIVYLCIRHKHYGK